MVNVRPWLQNALSVFVNQHKRGTGQVYQAFDIRLVLAQLNLRRMARNQKRRQISSHCRASDFVQ